MKRIEINENHFDLHPSGAGYWVEKKTLLLADVHLGKVAHFRKNGIAVPRKAEGAFYEKITLLLNEFEVDRILFLGDLFHSFQNNEWNLFSAWVKKQQSELILIEGNHDVIPASQFEQIGFQVIDHFLEEAFYFSHFPTEKTTHFVFCGHVHPGVKLKGNGLQQMKMPCFFQNQNQLILPAFGAFTGLHLLSPKAGDHVYVTTGKEVMEIEGI
ncbi:MAG: ligase-associated DNA damage response endonuclease PdeM [Flavobacteriaceae bacterium]|nr:ligase-associated DNA damage response endonuclease PdeM [Flavobacteriaceae bacterium]